VISVAPWLTLFSGKLSDDCVYRDLADPDDEKGCPETNRILDELLPDSDADEKTRLSQSSQRNAEGLFLIWQRKPPNQKESLPSEISANSVRERFQILFLIHDSTLHFHSHRRGAKDAWFDKLTMIGLSRSP
jgi:hypothetical protein